MSSFPNLPQVALHSTSWHTLQGGYCKVRGTIETEINFELLLPRNWNGKFAMGGGGGFVGSVDNIALLYGAVRSGYASAGTDTGHSAHRIDARWALNNPERLENFGHRAVHLTATTAKALLATYYGRESTENYFIGCSRGGGQGLMEAQRYPDDFDGIVAGAPAFNWPMLAANGVQIAQKMFPDPDNLQAAVIGPAQQTLIEQTYLNQCDALDGLEDGIIEDPRACPFDITTLQCTSAAQTNCLSDTQVAAMQQVYGGAKDNQGQLYFGYPIGGETSDQGMGQWLTGGTQFNKDISKPQEKGGKSAPTMPNATFGFSTGIMKNMIFNDPDWDYSTYDFEGFRDAAEHAASVLNATDPDLRLFRQRGGKLLMYHGWSDMALSAFATIDYYEQILTTDPSASTDVRLYMMPGVDHCIGGTGPSLVNFLTVIDQWVTSGTPPEALTARWLRFGIVPTGSRPICPFPQRAVYNGEGKVRRAHSYHCAL